MQTVLPSTPTFTEVVQITMKIGDKVDVHWRQFFAVQLALVAWLSSKISTLSSGEAAVVSLGIVLFACFNAIGLVRSYVLLKVAISEAYEHASRTEFFSDIMNKYKKETFAGRDFRARVPLVVLTHLVSAGFVVYLVWQRVPGG